MLHVNQWSHLKKLKQMMNSKIPMMLLSLQMVRYGYNFCFSLIFLIKFITDLGMVMFNGGLLDVQKLLDQLKRSENAREETEQQLVDLRKQNTDLNASYSKANSKIKDLSSDVKSYNRKLNDVEQNLSSTNVSTTIRYLDCIFLNFIFRLTEKMFRILFIVVKHT